MKKFRLLLCILTMIAVIVLTGCDASNPASALVVNTPTVDIGGTPITVTAVVADPLPVTGTVVVNNTVPVSVVNTVPVTGSVGITTPITIAGTVPVTGSVIIPTPLPIIQHATADPNNSSTVNLNAGATFTGTNTSTLGVNSIQVSLKTDQNCTVFVDQSPDGLNWDITDTYNYITSFGGNSWTVQAVNSDVRVRVKNVGSAITTYFRLQTVLCPIVEAIPRSLDPNARLKVVTTITDTYGFDVEVTPFNELRVAESVKIAGTVFIGTTLDTNFVASYTASGGTVTQGDGQLTLQTNTTVNGYAEAYTARRARFIAGTSNMCKMVIQLPDAALAGNTRRWGIGDLTTAPTITDGAFFELNGTTFEVVTMKASTPTVVASGSFNGTLGATYTLDTNEHVYEIYYSPYAVYFTIDGELLHTVLATTATWTSTVTLYCGMDDFNTGAVTTNRTLQCRAFNIHRLGPLDSAPVYKHFAGVTAATVLKYGAGTLHNLVLNSGNAATTITLYDNTSAAGTVIAIIAASAAAAPTNVPYELDFYTGLTIVVAGAATDITIVYE